MSLNNVQDSSHLDPQQQQCAIEAEGRLDSRHFSIKSPSDDEFKSPNEIMEDRKKTAATESRILDAKVSWGRKVGIAKNTHSHGIFRVIWLVAAKIFSCFGAVGPKFSSNDAVLNLYESDVEELQEEWEEVQGKDKGNKQKFLDKVESKSRELQLLGLQDEVLVDRREDQLVGLKNLSKDVAESILGDPVKALEKSFIGVESKFSEQDPTGLFMFYRNVIEQEKRLDNIDDQKSPALKSVIESQRQEFKALKEQVEGKLTQLINGKKEAIDLAVQSQMKGLDEKGKKCGVELCEIPTIQAKKEALLGRIQEIEDEVRATIKPLGEEIKKEEDFIGDYILSSHKKVEQAQTKFNEKLKELIAPARERLLKADNKNVAKELKGLITKERALEGNLEELKIIQKKLQDRLLNSRESKSMLASEEVADKNLVESISESFEIIGQEIKRVRSELKDTKKRREIRQCSIEKIAEETVKQEKAEKIAAKEASFKLAEETINEEVEKMKQKIQKLRNKQQFLKTATLDRSRKEVEELSNTIKGALRREVTPVLNSMYRLQVLEAGLKAYGRADEGVGAKAFISNWYNEKKRDLVAARDGYVREIFQMARADSIPAKITNYAPQFQMI